MAKTLFRRSFILIATAACAAAVAFTGLALLIMDRIYVEANYRVLGETVRALVPSLPDSVLSPDEGGQLAAAAWAASSVGGSDLRLTLIRPDGVVIADTRANPAAMENHASRPEVRSALAGSLGTARRTSATIGLQLIYAAFPIVRNGATAAVLRLAIEVPSLGTRLSPELGNILLLVAVFLAAAAAAALAFSRWLSLPLQKLAAAAQGYASIEGARPADSADAPRAPSPSTPAGAAAAAAASTPRPALAGFRTLALHSRDLPDEYRVLATSLDAMAGELALRVDKARSQGRELQAILNAMAEAVMALDGQLRIRLANPAAARLFEPDRAGGTAAGLTGRDLLESTRSVELSDLVDDCLGSGEQRERELALYQGGERWYQALAAPLGAAD
ncbi:MAG TPA: PAS domain-containing protein, partial [Rectinemataceae bacterium]|nr:PAS domain-containing protein [Rectinemataceae bacterium]